MTDLLALAKIFARPGAQSWAAVQAAAEEAGPGMRSAIPGSVWDELSSGQRAGILWDMGMVHRVGGMSEGSRDRAGTRWASLADGVRHAHLVSLGRKFSERADATKLADGMRRRLFDLPDAWQTECLRRVHAGDLDPFGAIAEAEISRNLARNVFKIDPE